MSEENVSRLEKMLEKHMTKHDEDYKRMMWWIIGTLAGVVLSAGGWFISIGQTVEKVDRLEIDVANKVDRQELLSAVALINEKFGNVNEKLDDIKRGLNIK